MSPKVRNLWLIAGAIALAIVILGRSPLPVRSASSVAGAITSFDAPSIAQQHVAQQELPAPDPAASPEDSEQPSLDIETYQDPQGRFEVGILDDFNQLSVAGSPLFESPDGAIAYTVVTQDLFEAEAEPLPAATLAAIAITTFNQGEDFQNQPSEQLESDPPAIRVPWQGTHTSPTGSQPISGKILVQQRSGTVFLVLVAATEAGRDRQDTITNTVFSTFTLL